MNKIQTIMGPQQTEVVELIESDDFKNQMTSLLGNIQSTDRMVRVVAAMMDQDIAKCSRISILKSVLKCCFWNLEPGNDMVYLINYGGHLHAQLGYGGCQVILSRLPGYHSQQTELVYPNDHFIWGDKLVNGVPEFQFEHAPSTDRGEGYDGSNSNNLVLAYSMVTFKRDHGGFVVYKDRMLKEEIENTRKRASSGGQGWNYYGEMAKKTVVHRLFKRIPQSPQMAVASQAHDALQVGDAPTWGGLPVDVEQIEKMVKPSMARLSSGADTVIESAGLPPASGDPATEPDSATGAVVAPLPESPNESSGSRPSSKGTRKKSSKLVARDEFLALAWKEAGVGEKNAVETALHFSKRDDARTMTREDWEANTKRVMKYVSGRVEEPPTEQPKLESKFIEGVQHQPPSGEVKEQLFENAPLDN